MIGNMNVKGFYFFEVGNEEGTRDLAIAERHENMVVNTGLDALATSGNLFYQCAVGTDNSVVLPTQTALGAQVGITGTILRTTSGAVSVSSTRSYKYLRVTFRFNKGVATGSLNEVAVFSPGSPNKMLSRSLIVDTLGNPTTLTVLSDEWLDVTYELQFHVDLTPVVFTATIAEEVYNITCKPARHLNAVGHNNYTNSILLNNGTSSTAYNGANGTVEGLPTGSSSSGTLSTGTYVNGSYEADIMFSGTLDQLNLTGGIKSLLINLSKTSWQFEFDKPLLKDSYRTVVFTFKLVWGRGDGT